MGFYYEMVPGENGGNFGFFKVIGHQLSGFYKEQKCTSKPVDRHEIFERTREKTGHSNQKNS
jgi:hypothetical protein